MKRFGFLIKSILHIAFTAAVFTAAWYIVRKTGHIAAKAFLAAAALLVCYRVFCMIRDWKNPFLHQNFDRMTGYEFEEFCAKLLSWNGFRNVRQSSGSRDHGVDLVAEYEGSLIAVQCKCYGKPVGNTAVQEVYSGKDIYLADYAAVLTNSCFTPQAEEDAEKLGVFLWGREELMALIRRELKL